jgi:L,D-transpeptidase catalytic domain
MRTKPLFPRRALMVGLALCGALATTRVALAGSVQLRIDVDLPLDRTQTGRLRLIRETDGANLTGDMPVLGRASRKQAEAVGNADRVSTLRNGHTPTGSYKIHQLAPTGDGTGRSSYSYGPHGAYVLEPISGDALTAKQNGRTGLLIHSGDPGEGGLLRATLGCLRLSNDNMRRLIEAVRAAGDNPVMNRCELVELSVLVGDPSSEGAGDDEADPPNGIDLLLAPGPILP